MRGSYRLAVYVLVTAFIEVPSILVLYSYGYPNSPSSTWIWIFMVVENAYFFLLWSSAVGGPIPGQGPRDISFDVVWGVVSMFMIIAVIGEAFDWLGKRIAEMKRQTA